MNIVFISRLIGPKSIAISFWYALFFSNQVFSSTVELVAATLEYPPYQYTLNGRPKGFAVDVINEASDRLLDTKVSFNFYPWKRAVFSAQTGSSDVLFNAGKNKARQKWGRYTKTVLINQKYVLFKKRNSNISVDHSFSSTNKYSIAVRAGYLYGSGSFRKALDTNKFLGVEYSESTIQSIDMLLGGRVDLFVGDYLPVIHYIKENNLSNEIDIIEDPVQVDKNLVVLNWPTYLLFNKKNVSEEFVNRFDEVLLEMTRDGTYRELYQKYHVNLEISN